MLSWHRLWDYLARWANLPTGLCILPSVISSFFYSEQSYLSIYWTDFHDLFTKCKVFAWISWSGPFFPIPQGTLPWQPILCRKQNTNRVRFLQFLHHMKALFWCRWWIWNLFFQYLKGRCHDNQFCFVPDSFAWSRSISGSTGPIFTIFAPYGRYWMADDQSDLLSRYLKGRCHGNQSSGKMRQNCLPPCTYRSVIQKRYGITPCMCKIK